MKKLFCILLAIAMLLSLCACGKDDTDNVRGTISDKEPEFSLGKASGSTYTNEFLGVEFALPAGWEFYTEKQILELNNLVGEYLDEDAAERLKNAAIIYDMYAHCPANGNNVNINLEKLSAAQLVKLNIKEVLESQIDTMTTAFKNMGLSDIKIEYQKVTVDGKEFDGLTIVAKAPGVDLFETVFTFRQGNYLANIAVCSTQTNTTASILSNFSID